MKQIFILQIEHPVTNFELWKKAFDNDPARREQSGVLRYKILRPVDNMNYIIVDLEFDSLDKAQAFQAIIAKSLAGSRWKNRCSSPKARMYRVG